jgi:hypothetical protein
VIASRVRRASVALILAAGLFLSGCGAPAPATQWRDLVGRAAQQASEGDYVGASSTLTALEQEVAAARDAGELEATRAEEILAAAATVRGDLSALSAPTPTPVPTPTEEPAAPAPVEPVPEPDGGDEDANTGENQGESGNDGSGNGNGGNGNSDDSGKDDGGKADNGKEKDDK